jgi:hypothetical protein
MARFLMAVLAVITAALGYLMDNTWLLIAAGIFFLLALLTLIVLAAKRRTRRSAGGPGSGRGLSREDELRSLGISDVRPRARAETSAPEIDSDGSDEPSVDYAAHPTVDEPEFEEEDTEELAGGAAVTPETGPLPEREHHPATHQEAPLREPRAGIAYESASQPRESTGRENDRDESRMLHANDDHPFWEVHSPTAFASFLRAMWAATEVQTALLATAENDGTYTLLEIRSHLPGIRKEGRFPVDSFLRVAHPDRPITVLAANDPLLRDIPYYRTEAHVSEVAVMPVTGPDGRVLYLVGDLPLDQPTFTERQRALLLGFADLLRTMLEHPPEEETPARAVPTRRAIISEEMSRARAQNRPLALALVYRVDAESLAEKGKTAVAEAERGLRLLLEDLVHHGRLERFGELMFGAFLRDETSIIETWADRVQRRAQEEGFSVAIGVAPLGGHRDADALRADAANALAEALASEDRFVVAETAHG